MYKILLSLLLVTVVAAAPEQDRTVSTYENECPYNDEIFVDLNRRKLAQIIQFRDTQMKLFRQKYISQINTLNTTSEMLLAVVAHTEERLTFLKVLSEQSNRCSEKYLFFLPDVYQTKTLINACRQKAYDQLNGLLVDPLTFQRDLKVFYSNNFDGYFDKCKKPNTPNYTKCILDGVAEINTYTSENYKAFEMAMDTAQCSANINIKKALDCAFTAQNHTISMNYEVNSLVDSCLLGQNYCTQYNQKCYSCSNVYNMKKSEVDYNNKTMTNVFYYRQDIKNCLMLNIN